MKKDLIYKIAMVLLFLGSSLFAGLQAQTEQTLFETANEAYKENRYEEAIAAYEQILDKGVEAPDLYYNLGNAYYKQASLGKAILYYEKALKLNPADEDVMFNLEQMHALLTDKISTVPEPFYREWANAFKSTFSIDTWARLAVIFMGIAFVFALLFLWAKQAGAKRMSFIVSGLTFLVAILLTLIAWRTSASTQKEAIMMAHNSYIKSAPDDNSEDLFILHEGTKVVYLEYFDGWKKIKLSDGMIGWVKGNTIEEI